MFILPLHQHPLSQVEAEVVFHQGIRLVVRANHPHRRPPILHLIHHPHHVTKAWPFRIQVPYMQG